MSIKQNRIYSANEKRARFECVIVNHLRAGLETLNPWSTVQSYCSAHWSNSIWAHPWTRLNHYLFLESIDSSDQLIFLFLHRADVFLDVTSVEAARLERFHLLVSVLELCHQRFVLQTQATSLDAATTPSFFKHLKWLPEQRALRHLAQPGNLEESPAWRDNERGRRAASSLGFGREAILRSDKWLLSRPEQCPVWSCSCEHRRWVKS